jgi:hypothetical protein
MVARGSVHLGFTLYGESDFMLDSPTLPRIWIGLLALASLAGSGPAVEVDPIPPVPLVALRQQLAALLADENSPPAPALRQALTEAHRILRPRRVALSWEIGALRRARRVVALAATSPLNLFDATLDELREDAEAEFISVEDCLDRRGSVKVDAGWDRLDAAYEILDRTFDATTFDRAAHALQRAVRAAERVRATIDPEEACAVRMEGRYGGDWGALDPGSLCNPYPGGAMRLHLRQVGTLVNGSGALLDLERFDADCEFRGYAQRRFTLRARIRQDRIAGVMEFEGLEPEAFEGYLFDFGVEWEAYWSGTMPGDFYSWR